MWGHVGTRCARRAGEHRAFSMVARKARGTGRRPSRTLRAGDGNASGPQRTRGLRMKLPRGRPPSTNSSRVEGGAAHAHVKTKRTFAASPLEIEAMALLVWELDGIRLLGLDRCYTIPRCQPIRGMIRHAR
jgi:hypothetical protein